MGTYDDGKTLKVVAEDEVLDEGLFATSVKIAVAQWSDSTTCKASISSMTARHRW